MFQFFDFIKTRVFGKRKIKFYITSLPMFYSTTSVAITKLWFICSFSLRKYENYLIQETRFETSGILVLDFFREPGGSWVVPASFSQYFRIGRGI